MFNNILLLGIRDLQSFHEETRQERSKSDDNESGGESGEEMGEDYDLEDETEDIEATMSCHHLAFLPYRYTRLPCAAHKVGLESLETPLYFLSLQSGSPCCGQIRQRQVPHVRTDSHQGPELHSEIQKVLQGQGSSPPVVS